MIHYQVSEDSLMVAYDWLNARGSSHRYIHFCYPCHQDLQYQTLRHNIIPVLVVLVLLLVLLLETMVLAAQPSHINYQYICNK